MVALYPEDTAWFLYGLLPGYMLKDRTPGIKRGRFWRVSSRSSLAIEERVDGYIREQLTQLDGPAAGEGAGGSALQIMADSGCEIAVLLARIEEIGLGLAVELPPEGAWRKRQRLEYTRKAFLQALQRLRLIQIEWDKFQTLIDDEELGMVVRMLAHEIAGTLTLVVNSDSMEERVEKALARSTHLVNQLQEVPSLRSGFFAVDPGSVSLAKMIDDVVQNVKPVWDDKAFLVGWGVDEEIEVVGDENLYSVLQNVVFNALSFAREKVEIEVEPGERREHVLIKVTDDGPGVPLEDKEWIFKPMVAKGTAYRPRGKGVGLFIARTIAREVSGDVYLGPPANGRDRSNQFVIQLTATGE
jgi:signal transduction histidine kinase